MPVHVFSPFSSFLFYPFSCWAIPLADWWIEVRCISWISGLVQISPPTLGFPVQSLSIFWWTGVFNFNESKMKIEISWLFPLWLVLFIFYWRHLCPQGHEVILFILSSHSCIVLLARSACATTAFFCSRYYLVCPHPQHPIVILTRNTLGVWGQAVP